MAKSLSFRSFSDNGDEVVFHRLGFRREVLAFQGREVENGNPKPTLEKIYGGIADKVNVSPEAVKNWYKGNNGVSDMNIIKGIAEYLQVDYKNLIVRKSEAESRRIEQNFNPMGTDEKAIILQTHELLIDYTYWFIGTFFESYAYHVLENPEEERLKYIWNLYHFLDRTSLYVSADTHKKLRQITTELEYMFSHEMRTHIPKLWNELNPRIMDIYKYSDYLEETNDINELFGNVLDKNSNEDLKEWFCTLMHLAVEDIGDVDVFAPYTKNLSKELQMAVEYSDRHTSFLPAYSFITREVADTITLVMRHHFPQYFQNNETP